MALSRWAHDTRCDGLWSGGRLCCAAARLVRVMRKLWAEAWHEQAAHQVAGSSQRWGFPACRILVPRLRSSKVVRALFVLAYRESSGEGRSFFF
jgi:hypothetical protein